MKKFFATIAVVLMAGGFAPALWGQGHMEDLRWGSDEEERMENIVNYNLLKDFVVRDRNYDEAMPLFRELIAKVPESTQQLYIYGVTMYRDKAEKAEGEIREMYVDSMMMMYDKRIETFASAPNMPEVRRLKALSYHDFKPKDSEGNLRNFRTAVDDSGDAVEPFMINMYMGQLNNFLKQGSVDTEYYLSEFTRLEPLMNKLGGEEDVKNFQQLLVASGAADCGSIEDMFRPLVAAAPEDTELLNRAITLLERARCTGSFYTEVAELYYKVDPSTNTALALARAYENMKDYSSALKYLNAALANETDPTQKLRLSLRIAGSELGAGNSRNAADFARRALAIDPESGLAYYMLAQAYAEGAKGCTEFDRQSAYWLVYDTLATARRLVKADEISVGDIDRQMGMYRLNFPNQEECFWRNLKDGDSYTVSCGWVSGNTVVRVRK